jgi:5,10-methylenetetrahydromethanopterin reductase
VPAPASGIYSPGVELWTMSVPEPSLAVALAQRAEEAGFDGITFTDSQNLCADPFIGAALAAMSTTTLQFATGVTNAHTRHPAALATVAATVQEAAGGRFVLGIGRGDTALFHLGLPPMPVATFARLVTDVQTYLGGGTIDVDGHPSRIHWLDRAQQPKVPLDIAASGPKVLELGGRISERVTLAVGADPSRVGWAIDLVRKAAIDNDRDASDVSIGAYVNVGCHPDVEVARTLISGGVAAFAHFSSMPGSTGAGLDEASKEVVAEVGRRYDSNMHLQNSAPHAQALEPAFVDRFAVVGPPATCAERILALHALGVERFVVTGASFGADRDDARTSQRLLVRELLPELRERAAS